MKLALIKPGHLDRKTIAQEEVHPGVYFIKQLAGYYDLRALIYGFKDRTFRYKRGLVTTYELVNIKERFLYRMRYLQVCTRMITTLLRWKPAALITMGAPPEFVPAFIYSRITRTPLIVVFAGILAKEISTMPGAGLLKAFTVKALRSSLTRKVLCVSKKVKQELASHGVPINKLEVFSYERPGTKFLKKPCVDKAGSPRVLFVGRIVKAKGVYELLEVAELVRKKMSGVVFDVIGTGMEETRLARMVKQKGLTGTVRVLGKKPLSQLPAYYQRSTVFFLPTHWEALGQVAIEATLAGVPVVASKTGGIGEVVQDGKTGFLVNVGDVQGYANAILNVLIKKQLRAALCRNIISAQKRIMNPVNPLFGCIKKVFS